MRYFDKWQKLILVALILSHAFFIVAEFALSTYLALEENLATLESIDIDNIEIPFWISAFASIGLFGTICFGGWFLIRTITFKVRKKEAQAN